jgi:hypothetical protein
MKKDKYDQQLLVEGKDDQHVIWALCEKFAVSETFDVIDCEGIDKLIEQIPARLKKSGNKALGIVIDADTDSNQRWQSLKDTFSSNGYNFPNELPENGLVHRENDRRIGIWLMPNNNLQGMLEDFVKFLIPENDKLAEIAELTLAEIENRQLNGYNKEYHKSKAFIHTWLAWQEAPGTPMGLAITKKYLSTNDKVLCNLFISWLNSLFVTE